MITTSEVIADSLGGFGGNGYSPSGSEGEGGRANIPCFIGQVNNSDQILRGSAEELDGA